MFCNRCGKELTDAAIVCVGCGCPVKPLGGSGVKWGTGAIVGLVIGTILMPLLGIVFGIIGLTKEGKKEQGTALLILGIVTWIIHITWMVL